MLMYLKNIEQNRKPSGNRSMESNNDISLDVSSKSKPKQTIMLNPQTVEQDVHLDNYIKMLSNEELSETVISNKNGALEMQPRKSGITKPTETMSANPSDAGILLQTTASNMNQFSDITPNYKNIIDKNEDSAQNIYEDIIAKKKLDTCNNPKITSLDQLDISVQRAASSKNHKIALVLILLVGLVITIPAVSLIVWGVKFRGKETERRRLTATGFTAWAQAPIYYEKEEVIRFFGVLQNENGLYSSATGQLLCNVSGLYYIAITLKRMTDALAIKVYNKRGEVVLTAASKGNHNQGISISNSRLVECLEGEYLVLRSFGQGSLYGEAGVPHSTFTAFLLHATDTSMVRPEMFVGFSARKIRSQSYNSGDTIAFSSVLVNKGGRYQDFELRIPTTPRPNVYYAIQGRMNKPDQSKLAVEKRFSCAFAGLYYVSVTLKKSTSYGLNVCVTKSTEPFLHLVDSERNNVDSTVSNTAVIRCQPNEVIVVKGTGWGNIKAVDQDVENTFTAMLIHADVGHSKSAFIGFSMYKKTTQDFNISQTINFEGEIFNEGNFFQLELNQFNCPVNAVYYISLNAKKDGYPRRQNYYSKISLLPLRIDVKLQTDTIFRVESTETKNSARVMSNSALVRCYTGQVMRVEGAGPGSVYGHSSERHTTFTVFMLHQN